MTYRAITACLVVCAATSVAACGTVKAIIRGVDDVAENLCQIYFMEHPEELKTAAPKLAVSGKDAAQLAEEACKYRDVLDPFIDHVTRVKAEGVSPTTSASPECPPAPSQSELGAAGAPTK